MSITMESVGDKSKQQTLIDVDAIAAEIAIAIQLQMETLELIAWVVQAAAQIVTDYGSFE